MFIYRLAEAVDVVLLFKLLKPHSVTSSKFSQVSTDFEKIEVYSKILLSSSSMICYYVEKSASLVTELDLILRGA